MNPIFPNTFQHSTLLSLAVITLIATIKPCICLAAIATMSTASTTTKQGCLRQCGNVTIPYPFGIGLDNGCSLNPHFDVFCDLSSDPPLPYLLGRGRGFGQRSFEILEISESHIRARNGRPAIICFNSSGQQTTPSSRNGYTMSLTPDSPFAFSQTSNSFTLIGCHENGYVNDGDISSSGTANSCSSRCSSKEEVVAGQCERSGCCHAPIPKGLRSISVYFGFDSNNSDVVSFNPCGYAFVGEQGRFTFGGVSDLNDPNFVQRVIDTVPVVIDWVIGNDTCEEARSKPGRYVCMGNTTCSDQIDTAIGGYKCSCQSGFQGNPYLSPGCSDIDECTDPKLSNCTAGCVNTIGSFKCTCPPGYTGDGTNHGTGCVKTSSQNFVLKVCLGASSGVLFLVIGLSWLFLMDRKRKLILMKKNFFERNGGWLLQEQLLTVTSVGNTEPTKIFTEEQLKSATNNFDSNLILGTGGYGTVYRGVLPNNQVVAIKKSKVIDQSQIQQFINEVVILGQVNHRNVVRLHGCCLETEVPLLVYEYISKGTLYSHIHEPQNEGEKSWRPTWSDCLRIASEAADALAYLHSAASPPIIHRDIKSMNILLDENYTAKVADFGASRLIPMDQSQLSTLVQGTLGYLDPEYFHSSFLTEKSDVYSFGVLLAELITRQKPLSPMRREEDRNLATYFVRSVEKETLFDVVDPQWTSEASELEIVSMASITQKCLKLSGRDRPTMREVSIELEAIKKLKKPLLENKKHGDTESSLLMNFYRTSIMTETTTSFHEEEDLYPILGAGR